MHFSLFAYWTVSKLIFFRFILLFYLSFSELPGTMFFSSNISLELCFWPCLVFSSLPTVIYFFSILLNSFFIFYISLLKLPTCSGTLSTSSAWWHVTHSYFKPSFIKTPIWAISESSCIDSFVFRVNCGVLIVCLFCLFLCLVAFMEKLC